MPKKWVRAEEIKRAREIKKLYIEKNKTIIEIGFLLKIAPQTVYKRMVRLGIPTNPQSKITHASHPRTDITLPQEYSEDLAEFFGIMLGDGALSPYQIRVTLGTKELLYAKHVARLIKKIFSVYPKIFIRKNDYRDVYFGSVELSRWLRNKGLVYNKVKSQVSIPSWIFSKSEYAQRFLRGFLILTDLSIG